MAFLNFLPLSTLASTLERLSGWGCLAAPEELVPIANEFVAFIGKLEGP